MRPNLPTPLRLATAWLLAAAPGLAPAADASHDYPTAERVLYVQECVATHPGPQYEMVNKCACALDAMARELTFDDYVTLSTAAKATTIGGERGSYIREAPSIQAEIKRYKALQSKAEKSCFLGPAVPR